MKVKKINFRKNIEVFSHLKEKRNTHNVTEIEYFLIFISVIYSADYSSQNFKNQFGTSSREQNPNGISDNIFLRRISKKGVIEYP